jgi:protein-S-isoprenylcysteine O-methyltransferase Ste14
LEGHFAAASTNMAVSDFCNERLPATHCAEEMMFAVRFFHGAVTASTAAALLQSLPASISLSSRRAFEIEGKAWFIWAVYWLAMAFFSKSTKRRESPMQRFEHLIPAVLGFLFIFRPGFGGRTLTLGIIPDYPAIEIFCVIATIAGLLFAVWARLALGANWSGSVTIKKDHQLIRRGPYRWIRHPIYTGMLAALLATAITQGLISGLLGFCFVYAALYRKARREESFLSQEFGAAFGEHRQHTGMFLPRFS